MSPYSGSKCNEEEALDMLYLEIEERIMLLISEAEEEEDQLKKIERVSLLRSNKSSFLDASWYNNSIINQLQPTKQRRCNYGSENIGKKNEPWIQYGARMFGGKRMSEISGRRGTGVFIPKTLAHSC